jgi:asparagine synthase (glutamine-hydrolysing)
VPYQPPSLTAYLCRRTDGEGERHRRRSEELTGALPSRSLTTASWVAHVQVSPASAVVDAAGVGLVLHGETYDDGADPGLAIASSWSAQGNSAVTGLTGSYALLVADRARDDLSVVTDRLGSRRLFCSALDGATLISSSLAPHRQLRRTPDPTGVASYLVNGRAYGGRTVLEGVRLLEGATVHRLTDRGLVSTPYWQVRFDPTDAPEHELRGELSERLAAAVERCLFDRPTPFLALSGGKDSRGVGGELRWSAGLEDVECFSFVRGAPRPGCDEQVAAEIARLLGYRHRLVQSYHGDLVGLLLDNARLGEGNTNLVHEVAGWAAMAERFDAVERPVALNGDTLLGWDDVPLRSPQDVLDALFIHGMDAAPLLREVLPGRAYRDMAEGVEADRDAISARCADIGDLHDAADLLNIEQRLPHVILPWREAVPGRMAAVRRPMLDNDLLDFVTTLPTELRRGKRLYRRMLAAKYPTLSRIPLARDQNFRVHHATEVPSHAEALRHLIDRQSSVVDDVVPPEVAHQFLCAAGEQPRDRLRAQGRGAAKRLVPAALRARVRSRYPPPLVSPIPPSLLLVRLLILRAGLPR